MAENVRIESSNWVVVECTDGTSFGFRPDCDVNDITALGKEVLERCKGQ